MDYNPYAPSFPLRLRSTYALARGIHRAAKVGYPASGQAQYQADAATRMLLVRSRPRRTARMGEGAEERVIRLSE